MLCLSVGSDLMEISELVGTMLVQINEGPFNFTGMGTHCSFSEMLRGPLWAALRGRGRSEGMLAGSRPPRERVTSWCELVTRR